MWHVPDCIAAMLGMSPLTTPVYIPAPPSELYHFSESILFLVEFTNAKDQCFLLSEQKSEKKSTKNLFFENISPKKNLEDLKKPSSEFFIDHLTIFFFFFFFNTAY